MTTPVRKIAVAAHRTFASVLGVIIAICMLVTTESNARADDASLVGTVHIRRPSEVPLDWTKKSLFMLGGLGAFALVYAPGVGSALSRPGYSEPDPANKPLLIPFVGPAIYWGHWIGHIHDGVDSSVPPALTDLGAGIVTFALVVDTFIQVGGVTAFVYGAVAPIHKRQVAPNPELGRVHISPVLSFGKIGVVGTF
jgi:hypothetical protein